MGLNLTPCGCGLMAYLFIVSWQIEGECDNVPVALSRSFELSPNNRKFAMRSLGESLEMTLTNLELDGPDKSKWIVRVNGVPIKEEDGSFRMVYPVKTIEIQDWKLWALFGPMGFGPFLCRWFGHFPGVSGWLPFRPDDPGPFLFCPRCDKKMVYPAEAIAK